MSENARTRAISYLMPVVTATCPRRLNQPVTQLAMAACFFGVSMAAQKYGPPLVGCALQISVQSRVGLKYEIWRKWRS